MIPESYMSRLRSADAALSNRLWQLPRKRTSSTFNLDNLGQGDSGPRRPIQLPEIECCRTFGNLPRLYDVRILLRFPDTFI
jgi:hypothetical protein